VQARDRIPPRMTAPNFIQGLTAEEEAKIQELEAAVAEEVQVL
jgi:hypothetical protein